MATEPKDPAEENAMEDIDEECVMILKSISYPSFLYPDENNFYFKSSKPLSTHLFPLTVVKVLKTGSRAEQVCLFILYRNTTTNLLLFPIKILLTSNVSPVVLIAFMERKKKILFQYLNIRHNCYASSTVYSY